MVGKRVAIALLIYEKKPDGRRRKVKERFVQAVRRSGAQTGFAETVEEELASWTSRC